MGLITDAIEAENKASYPGPQCRTGRLLSTLDDAEFDELNDWLLSDAKHTAITRGLKKVADSKREAGAEDWGIWIVRPENVRRHRNVIKGIPTNDPCACDGRDPELLPGARKKGRRR